MKREHLFIRLIYLACVGLLGLMALWGLFELFLPIFLGFVLAFLSSPLVDHLERKGWGRATGSGMVFVLLFLLLMGTALGLKPVVTGQWNHFQDHWEEYQATFESKLDKGRNFASEYVEREKLISMEADARNTLREKWAEFQEQIPVFISMGLSAAGTFIFVPIIAFFFMVQGSEIKKFFVAWIPNRYFEMTLMILHEVNRQLGGYFRGQFFDCLVIGILWSIGLSLVGVKGAIAIGIFAGIANAVPYVGPILGAIPAIFMLLVEPEAASPWWTPAVVALVVNILDNAVVYPMTVGKSLSLHPLLVILGILFGGSVGGVLGMIVAAPVIGMTLKAFQVLHHSLKDYRII